MFATSTNSCADRPSAVNFIMFPSTKCISRACPFQPNCIRQDFCYFSHSIAVIPIPLPVALTLKPVSLEAETQHVHKKPKILNSIDDVPNDSKKLIKNASFTLPTMLVAPPIIQLELQTSPISLPHTTPSEIPLYLKDKPPKIKSDLTSNISKNHRQKVLTNFYNQFKRIYASILHALPFIAHEHACIQELKVSTSATPQTYTTLAVGVQSRLKKREPVLSVLDAGIDGEFVSKRIPLNRFSVEKFVCGIEALVLSRYPMQSILEEFKVSELGDVTCERCKGTYSEDACTYHPGKIYTKKTSVSETNDRAYMCCLKEVSSVGCMVSRHVFKEERSDHLHKLIAFITTPESNEERMDIAALDCEMVYTTVGFEVARLCVVNQEGIVVIDELCKTKGEIIDLNTTYSGITSLDCAKYELESLRELLFKHINAETILVGHGLENDLKVLRLIHKQIIDTAILFPFPKGPPYKYSLKQLAKLYLGRIIQADAGGHSPVEDAATCIDLIHARMTPGFKEFQAKDKNR